MYLWCMIKTDSHKQVTQMQTLHVIAMAVSYHRIDLMFCFRNMVVSLHKMN